MKFIFTTRKRKLLSLCFSAWLSVHKGVHAPGGSAPGGCLLGGGACSGKGVPALGGLLPGGTCSGGCGDTPRDGYCCGRYASYWNAFLLTIHTNQEINFQIPHDVNIETRVCMFLFYSAAPM